MPAELTDKQKAALERFKKLKVGALFMKQGTGKTRVALELVNYNKPDYLLYIAPVSTIENARAEIEKWGCCCPYDIIGYETIASSNKQYVEMHDKVERLKEDGKRTFIIADESIFIKNGKSKRTFRAKELRKFFDYALILNGTPLTRNEWDLFNQMDFLSNRILNMNYREFIKMFFVEHEHNGQRYHTFYEPNRPALVKLCAPYVYEADLDFENEEHSYMRWVICSQTAYKEAKERVLEAYGDYSIDSLLTLFSELQRIAANMPAKNEAVAEYIRERQCICFCNYRDEIEQILRCSNAEPAPNPGKAVEVNTYIRHICKNSNFRCIADPVMQSAAIEFYAHKNEIKIVSLCSNQIHIDRLRDRIAEYDAKQAARERKKLTKQKNFQK